MKYVGTQIDFDKVPATQTRDSVLASSGMRGIEASGKIMDDVADRLQDVCDQLLALYRNYPSAHEGEAAEATRAYIATLAQPGLEGVVKFRTAAAAFRNQSEYFATVYGEMQAVPEPPEKPWLRGGKGVDVDSRQSHDLTAQAASKYQANTNDNLANWFQVFDPPTLVAPDAELGPAPVPPAWPGTGGAGAVGVAGGLGASPQPTAPAVAPDPAAVGGGAAAVGGVGPGAIQPGGQSGQSGPSGPGTGNPSGTAVPPPVTPLAGSAPTSLAAKSTANPGAGRAGALPSGEVRTGRELPGVIAPTVPRSALGEPGAGRPGPSERSGVLGGSRGADREARGIGGAPDRGQLAERSSARAAAPTEEPAGRGGTNGRSTSSHLPFLPGGAGVGRGGEGHRRPDWLVEDDADSVWLADVPDHGPGVLRAEERGHGG